MNILQAIASPKLFAPWFKTDSYGAWMVFLCALFALPMSDAQFAIYQRHTGRTAPPTQPFNEAWMVVGRRGGKSFFMALVAVFLACWHDYRRYLAPGEVATVMIIAADRRQARVVMRYIRAMISMVPSLNKRRIGAFRAEGVDLINQVTIEVGTASFRATRGYTYAAVICDEIAFWRSDDDSANPDEEILNAIRPGMATIPTALLLCASSPHARRGELWEAFRRYWGKDEGPLVWKASTREMNPTINPKIIEQAEERDPARAAAEYGAEFRQDIEAFVNREVVEACVIAGLHERPPVAGIEYSAFVDPSGGSNDAMTLCIGHREDERILIDCLRERSPPFSPEGVVREFTDSLKTYNVYAVTGDRYAGEWPREQFRKLGIEYRIAEKPRSDLYRDMLPALNSATVELLDSKKLVNQIVGLERRVARGGKESIDHSPHSHDDLANAAAGAISLLAVEYHPPYATVGSYL